MSKRAVSEIPDKHKGLDFLFDTAPQPGQATRVCDGIDWYRLPLPFALDHVNCWVLGASGDQVLIDTGVALPDTKALWKQALTESSGGEFQVPAKVLITHFHPDHMGLAGWFAEKGASLVGSEEEVGISRKIWSVEDQEYSGYYSEWYQFHGLPAGTVKAVGSRGNSYKKIVAEPPASDASWSYLTEGQFVELAGEQYEVMIGRGHAPDMLMLYRHRDHVLIAADQVLPSITPNVSVMPFAQKDNPLKRFLDTIKTLQGLPEDTVVLPSHGLPFTGLHARLKFMELHHEQRLAEVLAACDEPKSAFELFSVLFRRELDAQQTSFALGESLAHLHFLEHRGALQRQVLNEVTRFVCC